MLSTGNIFYTDYLLRDKLSNSNFEETNSNFQLENCRNKMAMFKLNSIKERLLCRISD